MEEIDSFPLAYFSQRDLNCSIFPAFSAKNCMYISLGEKLWKKSEFFLKIYLFTLYILCDFGEAPEGQLKLFGYITLW